MTGFQIILTLLGTSVLVGLIGGWHAAVGWTVVWAAPILWAAVWESR